MSTLLLAAQITCWTPYAVLVLWTLVFPPHSLNTYLTLVPSICCKVCHIHHRFPVTSLLPAVSHTELLVNMEACAAYLSWVLLPQDRGDWTTAQAALGAVDGRKEASYAIAEFEYRWDICCIFNFLFINTRMMLGSVAKSKTG